jgi:plastocyanin
MTARAAFAAAATALVAGVGWARAGDVQGVVVFAGPDPTPGTLPVTKDEATCGGTVRDESIVGSGGRIANVAVVVKGAPPPAPGRAVLDQRRCRFVPHVQAVPVGSSLGLANSDPILHGVRGWMQRRSRFEVAMASEGREDAAAKLDRPGVMQIRCDVHSWMTAYIVVADGPAAVSGPDGRFEIRGVPAGRYTVAAWHERFGEQRVEVTVPESGAAQVELRFAP